MLNANDVRNLTSRDAVNHFFQTGLGYQVNSVPFDAEELGIPDAPAQFIREIEQLCNYQHQFQVYLMEVNSLRRTDLRSILEPFYRKHPAGNYLFIFTKDYDEIAFVSPLRLLAGDDGTKTKLYLRSLRIDRSNVYHTDLETLDGIRLLWEDIPSVIWEKHNEAFNIERVTRDFFTTYSAVFDEVKRSVTGIPDASERHFFTQTLFNRLMFCWFLQKKGWLNHEPDYFLRRLTDAKEQNKNFFDDVLYWLFFWAMNNPTDSRMEKPGRYALREELIGDVPFLNGGLFEMTKWDERGKAQIPDGVFDDIFRRLFSRYNFTVEESTPLDVCVAVDPEMLGKVFEKLVIKRHAQGSYYTPRDVVSFMCRESLKAYLAEQLPNEADAITALVDDQDISGLSIADAKRIADALNTVCVCDPACGSGAYLVGMLHELVDLSTLIYNPQLRLEPRSLYEHKLNIIQNNLYGVDIDPFAVNIAMLRMWLSLAVDHEVDDIADVQPLPNLNFKIQSGDSLTAPNPQEIPDLFRNNAVAVADKIAKLKAAFMREASDRKTTLRTQIEKEQGELAEALRYATAPSDSLDWRIAFAEVFANPKPENSGFDIVLANPPYVRADERSELLDYRAELRNSNIYETLYEKWDLYVAFLERGFQLLRQGGVLYYIISDAYTAAKYAKKSHEFFIKNAVIRRVDFVHDIQLFDAGVRNIMVCLQNREEPNHEPLRVYHRDVFGNTTVLPSVPQSEFGAVLFRPDGAKPMELPEHSVPLIQICYISYGLRANADERYWPGEFTTADCISLKRDASHPKPFVQGKHLVKWAVRRVCYLEYGTERAPRKFSRPTFPELYEAKEKLIAMRTPGLTPKVIYDNKHLHFDASTVGFVPWHYLKGVKNRSISKTAKYGWASNRVEREELSQQFELKYLLAIMNSTFTQEWLAKRRRSNKHIYPDDWKQLPILMLTTEKQEDFVKLVDAILAEFEQLGYPLPDIATERVSELDTELDERVAELYADATSSVDNDSD